MQAKRKPHQRQLMLPFGEPLSRKLTKEQRAKRIAARAKVRQVKLQEILRRVEANTLQMYGNNPGLARHFLNDVEGEIRALPRSRMKSEKAVRLRIVRQTLVKIIADARKKGLF